LLSLAQPPFDLLKTVKTLLSLSLEFSLLLLDHGLQLLLVRRLEVEGQIGLRGALLHVARQHELPRLRLRRPVYFFLAPDHVQVVSLSRYRFDF